VTETDPTLVPPTVDVDDESVAARLAPDNAGESWIATVLILRHQGEESGSRVEGDDVSARLMDEQGRELPIVERPSGPLVEAGGSLGVSANARFHFRATGAKPAELVVDYAGRTCRFEVRWPESGSEDEL
jgi:hypothetical protein